MPGLASLYRALDGGSGETRLGFPRVAVSLFACGGLFYEFESVYCL